MNHPHNKLTFEDLENMEFKKASRTGLEPQALQGEAPYFVTVWNLISYFFLVPFQIDKDENAGYIATSSKPRKMLCGIVHFFSVSAGSYLTYRTFASFLKSKRGAGSAFYVVSHIGSYIGTLFLFKNLWQEQSKIVQLVNIITIKHNKIIASDILTTTLVIIYVITAVGQGFSMGHQDSEEVVEILQSVSSPIVSWLGYNPVPLLPERVLRGVTFYLYSYFRSLGRVGILVIPILAQTMDKYATEEFNKAIERSYGNIPEFLKQFKLIREAVDIVKSCFGNVIVSEYIAILTFFADSPEIFLKHPSQEMLKFVLCWYLIFSSVPLYQAAQFNSKVETSLRRYISHHHWGSELASEERFQLISLTQELDKQPIGISCSFFTITMNFLGSTVGLVITYSLIVQMADSDQTFWDFN